MEIIQVKKDKKKYLDLLLLADEQEDMVDRYLERGDMFVADRRHGPGRMRGDKRRGPAI